MKKNKKGGSSSKLKKYILIVLAVLLCCVIASPSEENAGLEETLISVEQTDIATETEEWNSKEASLEYSENETQKKPNADVSKNETEPATTQKSVLPENSSFSVKFIDVGQADAALVECDGHYMLIDGGNKGDSNVIYSVLKKEGATHLDILVGTHAHEDHIGGLPGAFNYATADLTLCPVYSYDSAAFEDFAEYARQKGNGIVVPSVGDQYSLGSAVVTILGVNSTSDTNNTSIVLKIQYEETAFLFTGDAELEAEHEILNSGFDLSATVLKVGHHGSDTSTGYRFLREIMPEYAVISVGKSNSYGHPDETVLSRLRDADVTVFRTDISGDIVFTSDGKTVSVDMAKQHVIEETTASYSSVKTTDEESNYETDYVINRNTGKFHFPYCSSAKKMKESNKVYYTGTREKLIVDGYSPCGNCNP